MKAKTIKELAAEYGIDRKTFRLWLEVEKLMPLRVGRLFPPSAVNIIYMKLGNPKEYICN